MRRTRSLAVVSERERLPPGQRYMRNWENVVQGNVSIYGCVCRLWEGWQQRSRLRGHHVLMARAKAWVAMVAMAHTSRESLGAAVSAVPSRGAWGSEEANAVLAGPEDFVVTVKQHVAECKFAGGKSAVRARQTWTLYVDVACGMTVLAWKRVEHMARGQGLSGASDAIHANVSVHWKWNQARKGGTRRKNR